MRFLLASASAAILISLTPAKANDGPDWLSDPNDLPKGVVSNDNVMIKKDSSAMSLMMQADRALKSDKIDRALELIKRSLELNIDDLDAHMSYATALERKLATQPVEDPKLFNQCVKEWLAVLRNKYGEEKAETLGGIGIPGINGRFFADDERQVPARSHLVKLTGTAPKPWETDARFLAKVERHGEASVSGKMVHNPDSHDTYPNEKAPATSTSGASGKNARSAQLGSDPYPEAKSPGSESATSVGKSASKSSAQAQ